MLKIRFFLNEPNGKAWSHFQEMLPRLGNKEEMAIEVITKSRSEYQSEAYAELGLPKAPAIMIGSDVIVEGRDIDEGELTQLIARRLLEKWTLLARAKSRRQSYPVAEPRWPQSAGRRRWCWKCVFF